MKKRLTVTVIILAFAGSAIFAAQRYLTLAKAQEQSTQQIEDLTEAKALVERHPEVFQNPRRLATKGPLKILVQEASARNGIPLTYLAESEKDAGENMKERSVVCRAVNVDQTKFVSFLSDIESKTNGARIKEIRLKPSSERTGAYQEAEAVVAMRWLAEKTDGRSGQ